MWALGITYGANIVRQPDGTGEPGNAPASYSRLADAAVSLPSLLAPILRRMCVADVGPEPSNTSLRLIAILTGRLALRDSAETTGSRYSPPIPLPPKPPPISIGTTFTLDSGMPSTAEIWSRNAKSCCVLHHTVSSPSRFQYAVAECGSM